MSIWMIDYIDIVHLNAARVIGLIPAPVLHRNLNPNLVKWLAQAEKVSVIDLWGTCVLLDATVNGLTPLLWYLPRETKDKTMQKN